MTMTRRCTLPVRQAISTSVGLSVRKPITINSPARAGMASLPDRAGEQQGDHGDDHPGEDVGQSGSWPRR